MRVTPPAPGSSPSVTSGSPNCAFAPATAIRRWQASAISRPPPRAVPLSAATTGRPSVSSARSWRFISSIVAKTSAASSGVARVISVRSPPAKNVFLALVTTTPRMPSRSATRRSTARPIEAT